MKKEILLTEDEKNAITYVVTRFREINKVADKATARMHELSKELEQLESEAQEMKNYEERLYKGLQESHGITREQAVELVTTHAMHG